MNLLPLPETLALLADGPEAVQECLMHFGLDGKPLDNSVSYSYAEVVTLALNTLWRAHRGADRRDLFSASTLIARLATGSDADPFGTKAYARERWVEGVLEATLGAPTYPSVPTAMVLRLVAALYFTTEPASDWRAACSEARCDVEAALETHPNSRQLRDALATLEELLARRYVGEPERRRRIRVAVDSLGNTRFAFSNANAAAARRRLGEVI